MSEEDEKNTRFSIQNIISIILFIFFSLFTIISGAISSLVNRRSMGLVTDSYFFDKIKPLQYFLTDPPRQGQIASLAMILTSGLLAYISLSLYRKSRNATLAEDNVDYFKMADSEQLKKDVSKKVWIPLVLFMAIFIATMIFVYSSYLKGLNSIQFDYPL